MDTPPQIPPSQPATPPRGKGLAIWVIALIVLAPVLAIISILAVIALPSFKAVKEKTQEAEVAHKAAQPPATPIDDPQKVRALKFGETLATAMTEGKVDELSRLTNLDAFTERTFAGSGLPDAARAGFRNSVGKKPGGLLAQLAGAKARAIRFRERDGFPALTMRILPPGGGANFVDVLIKPEGESFMIVDLYGYLFGSYSSAEARQAMVLMQAQDGGVISRLLGVKGGDKKSSDLLMNMFRQMGNNDPKSVHHTYEELPEAVRLARSPYVLHLQALQTLQSDPLYAEIYAHMLENAREVLGKDTATDLLLVDSYFIKTDYKGAQRCLDNVMSAVGEDAYLYHLKGVAAIKDSDFEGAERSLAVAEKLEPELIELVDLRLQVRAAKKDYVGVVTELNRFAKATGAKLTPMIFNEPVYAGFKQSAEFVDWAKSVKP